MSRFRIFALLATVAALAIALAACGGDSDSSEDPQNVVENATLEGVESGELDLSVHVKAEGEDGGIVDVSLSGPFQGGGPEQLPELQLAAQAKGHAGGEKIDFQGGLTLLGDRAFIAYKGDEYEVDPTTFGFIKSSFEQAEQQAGAESGDVTACQKAVTGLTVDQFVENLKNKGSADVAGTSTTKVSGDLDVSGAVDALIALTKNPACASQLEAAGELPVGELEKAKGELSSSVKAAHVDLFVGDDEIIRKVDAELTVQPKDAKGEKVELELELTLSKVNEDQTITAPPKAKPLEALFGKLGVNPTELLEAGSSGGGIGGLLEGLDSSGGGSGGGGGSGESKAYVECLQGAESAADIQNCASLAQ